MNKWKEMAPRERDALIGEKIFGRQIERNGVTPGLYIDHIFSDTREPVSCYSTRLNAAWLVVRRMNIPDAHGKYDLYAAFIEALEQIVGSDMFYDLFFCNPDDPSDEHLTPERICLAALKAVGYVEEA